MGRVTRQQKIPRFTRLFEHDPQNFLQRFASRCTSSVTHALRNRESTTMEMELREGIAKLISVPNGQRDVLVWDSKQPGFFLRKFASGRAMWGVRYHVGNKQRRVHLYDAAVRGTLAKARNEAADVRAKARLGTDVVAARTAAAEAVAKIVTLGKLVERYLADRRDAKRSNGEPAWRPRYYIEVHRHLTRAWAPLAGTAIKSITRQDIVGVIDGIAAGQGRVTADQARVALSGLYAWAIDRGYCEATPLLHIKRRAENGARERTLTKEELREVWLASGFAGFVRHFLAGQRDDNIRWSSTRRSFDQMGVGSLITVACPFGALSSPSVPSSPSIAVIRLSRRSTRSLPYSSPHGSSGLRCISI
jgi:hypothetical protein